MSTSSKNGGSTRPSSSTHLSISRQATRERSDGALSDQFSLPGPLHPNDFGTPTVRSVSSWDVVRAAPEDDESIQYANRLQNYEDHGTMYGRTERMRVLSIDYGSESPLSDWTLESQTVESIPHSVLPAGSIESQRIETILDRQLPDGSLEHRPISVKSCSETSLPRESPPHVHSKKYNKPIGQRMQIRTGEWNDLKNEAMSHPNVYPTFPVAFKRPEKYGVWSGDAREDFIESRCDELRAKGVEDSEISKDLFAWQFDKIMQLKNVRKWTETGEPPDCTLSKKFEESPRITPLAEVNDLLKREQTLPHRTYSAGTLSNKSFLGLPGRADDSMPPETVAPPASVASRENSSPRDRSRSPLQDLGRPCTKSGPLSKMSSRQQSEHSSSTNSLPVIRCHTKGKGRASEADGTKVKPMGSRTLEEAPTGANPEEGKYPPVLTNTEGVQKKPSKARPPSKIQPPSKSAAPKPKIASPTTVGVIGKTDSPAAALREAKFKGTTAKNKLSSSHRRDPGPLAGRS